MNSPGQPANQNAPAEETAMREVALEMREVAIGSMRYAERVVLEQVNWTVRLGDFWAIGGLQASGKSDLLATAAGLMRPVSGDFRVFGAELGQGYEHELLNARLRVGLVFNGGRLLQHLTVAENISLPLRYHHHLDPDEMETRLRTLLEMIGLLRHAALIPNSLGLNWQQRVGLARALTLKPEVLLLDNPLTGLDPVHTGWWLNLLEQLSAGHPMMDNRPLTLVVTGDDLRPWRKHARQFAVLREKRFAILDLRPGEQGPEEGVLAELLWGKGPEKPVTKH